VHGPSRDYTSKITTLVDTTSLDEMSLSLPLPLLSSETKLSMPFPVACKSAQSPHWLGTLSLWCLVPHYRGTAERLRIIEAFFDPASSSDRN
jgi:hypothetical protein